MKAFWQLLRKDLLSQRWAMGILLVLTLGWHIFLSTKVGVWYREATLMLGLIPFSFIQLWVIWISFQIYRTEWSEDTAYLLLSLPVSSWMITGVKLLTVVLCTLFGVLVMLGSYLIFLKADIKPVWEIVYPYLATGWYKRNLINLGVLSLFYFIGSVILMHFAYLCSRMVNRFRGLVVIWVLLVSTWLTTKIAAILKPLLRWLPSIGMDIPLIENSLIQEIREFKIPAGPFVGQLLAVIALLVLANWLWEKQIEIA